MKTELTPSKPDLLAGIKIKRDSHFDTFSYEFPAGSGSGLIPIRDVLLWEILRELREIKATIKDAATPAL